MIPAYHGRSALAVCAALGVLTAVRAGDPAQPIEVRAHRAEVWCLAFSPDGRLIATCGKDKAVKLWDAATGKEVRTLAGHTGEVYTPAFLPDGRSLATCGQDGTIRVWDIDDGRELRKLTGHTGTVYTIAI